MPPKSSQFYNNHFGIYNSTYYVTRSFWTWKVNMLPNHFEPERQINSWNEFEAWPVLAIKYRCLRWWSFKSSLALVFLFIFIFVGFCRSFSKRSAVLQHNLTAGLFHPLQSQNVVSPVVLYTLIYPLTIYLACI